jgi:tight adherence protein C
MSVTLLIGLVACCAAIGLGLFALVAPAGAQANPGLSSIETYYSRDLRNTTGSSPPELSSTMQSLRAVATRLSPRTATGRLQHRLDIAGNPRHWTAERVLAFKGLGLVALALFGFLLGLKSPGLLVILPAALGALGFFLPDILLYNAGVKRQQKIGRALPDALDMLTVCVEAGLGFDASMAQVARNTEGPLAAEFARVLQEMQFGKSRVEALHALVERTTVNELRSFVSALVQASELGIPIATVLREQASEMRTRRRQRGEEQAQKVTVKILFPLIFCIFPALFVVVIGPGAIRIIQAFSHH